MARILLADDDKDIVELIRFSLEQHGHTVLCVYEVSDVLPLIKQEQFDLLILDIMMPGMDGYNLQKMISQDEQTKDVPIIMISAVRPAQALFEKSPQVKAFIAKPFDPDALMNAVGEALSRAG